LDEIKQTKGDNGGPLTGATASATGDAWQRAQAELSALEADRKACVITWMTLLFPHVEVHDHTSMHAHAMTEQDPQQVEVSSMRVEFATGAAGKRLQHPGCGRRRDLIVEEIHGISNSIPFEADISMKRLHRHVNGLHHCGVEGTTARQESS